MPFSSLPCLRDFLVLGVGVAVRDIGGSRSASPISGTHLPAKSKRGWEEGDGTENVINCRDVCRKLS